MSTPTVWASDFAEQHGLILRFDTPLPGNIPAYKYEDGDQLIVVLDSSLPEERQHFSLAHEAAHLILGHSGDLQRAEEQEANFLASELLLPDPPFSDFATQSLRELKEAFPFASFEALARRRMQFIPSVLTIMDNGQISQRLHSDEFAAPNRVTPPERAVLDQCMSNRDDLTVDGEDVRLHGTYVDDGRGVVRVLVIVEEA
jgi:IrrE N-terminal-like domain